MRRSTRLGVACFICLFICLFGYWACTAPDDKGQTRSLTNLKEEFEKIAPVPDSHVKRPTRANVKGSHGLVGNDYVSNTIADEIKTHYQTELLKRGWNFCRVERVIYRNQDYGGQHVFYRKGIYVADLQLAGRQYSEFGWTYAFSMSWGIFDDIQCS